MHQGNSWETFSVAGMATLWFPDLWILKLVGLRNSTDPHPIYPAPLEIPDRPRAPYPYLEHIEPSVCSGGAQVANGGRCTEHNFYSRV